MMTPIVALSARGEIVRHVQSRLDALGFQPGTIDGDFGPKTKNSVSRLQRSRGLESTGEVDLTIWRQITTLPPPTPRDRCLQLTAEFEGHGFSLARGNFDGSGITWGIIGFTLKHGSLGRIIRRIHDRDPRLLKTFFRERTNFLLQIINRPLAERLSWASGISAGPGNSNLVRPWRDAFARLGSVAEVQAEQLRAVETEYFLPSIRTARSQRLATFLGLALAFDIHVQNGGLKKRTRDRIARLLAAQPTPDERDRRIIIANTVADTALPQWREDVRSRKLAIASGAGKVHGHIYVLRNWGLSESPVCG